MSRSSIETRLKRLEAQQPDHTEGDSVVAFFLDGEFLRAERDGAPYNGPLEGHSLVVRVNFVSPHPLEGEPG